MGFIQSLFAQDTYLDIDANSFEANEQKNFILFQGNVKMKKKDDLLLCQILNINTNNLTHIAMV